MYQSTIISRVGRTSRALRRLAGIALVSAVCLIVTAGPAGAQTLGVDGKVYGVADCNLATKTASVSVVAMEPAAYATSGLTFLTQVWAKARYETKYNLIGSGQSPLIKTWAQYNPNPFVSNQLSWFNSPKTIFSTSFTGRVEAYYDIHVMYWFAAPGATQWTGPFSFDLGSDRDSHLTITSNDGFGTLSSPATVCFL